MAWRVTEAGHGSANDDDDGDSDTEGTEHVPGPWRLERVLAPTTACEIGGLLPATGVECRVRARNRIGWSPFGPVSDTLHCDGATAHAALGWRNTHPPRRRA